MEQWKEIIGKRIRIIFEDGANHTSSKEGILFLVTETYIVIKSDKINSIPHSRVIRFEVLK